MRIKDLAATCLGNILEWYDFGLFVYLAPQLGSIFFHADDIQSSSLIAFSVFAIGYICRPLGGIIFGFFGDTKGRVLSLRNSILIMSIATLSIGFLPGYATLGISSSILFTLLRMLQGISAGGEYCGIMIYLAESASEAQRGYLTSLAGSGSNLGFLLATLTVLLFKSGVGDPTFIQWAWRIPFILLGIGGSFIFYFRFKLPETKAYTYLIETHGVDQKPLWDAIRLAPASLLKILGLTCVSSIFYIIFFGFMPKYLAQYAAVPLVQSLKVQSVLLFIMLFLIPWGGKLGDKFGRKKLLTCTTVSIFLLSVPGFYLLGLHQYSIILAVMVVATLISSFDQGNNLATFVENCPIDVRYSGIGFAFNLGNALFGGTAPLILTLLLLQFGAIAPAYYLALSAVISFVAVSTLLTKNQTNNTGFLSFESK